MHSPVEVAGGVVHLQADVKLTLRGISASSHVLGVESRATTLKRTALNQIDWSNVSGENSSDSIPLVMHCCLSHTNYANQTCFTLCMYVL
jgi:hypothetical protein